MKTKSSLYRIFLMGLLFALLFNCKKKEDIKPLTVTISAVTNITATSATSGGEVPSDGGATVTAKGICYGVNQSPTITDGKTANGTGTGSFTSLITGLNPGITYYVRAYATNSVETVYSSQATFTTIALPPVLTTTDLSSITNTTASSGGNITNDGGAAVTARGVCWSITQNPTTSNSKTTDGAGTGTFTSSLTGLLHGTIYYVRAYATNSIGTTYGNQVSLTTIKNPLLGRWSNDTREVSFDDKGVVTFKIANNIASYSYKILNDSTLFMGNGYYWFQVIDITLITRNENGVTETYKKVP